MESKRQVVAGFNFILTTATALPPIHWDSSIPLVYVSDAERDMLYGQLVLHIALAWVCALKRIFDWYSDFVR